jgi:tuftelin-interacting protein 11
MTSFDLGNRLETTVYPVIRHKLSKALVNWHPSDRSAKLMLLPWHGVFSRGDMDAFLVKNIVPKLQLALQELVINPHQQHLGENESFISKMTYFFSVINWSIFVAVCGSVLEG